MSHSMLYNIDFNEYNMLDLATVQDKAAHEYSWRVCMCYWIIHVSRARFMPYMW